MKDANWTTKRVALKTIQVPRRTTDGRLRSEAERLAAEDFAARRTVPVSKSVSIIEKVCIPVAEPVAVLSADAPRVA